MSFKLITGSSLISALMLSACGPSQNQVRIAIPFGADDARFALMSQLVKNYNDYINKEEKNAKGYKDGYLPVTMYSSSNYINNSSVIESQLLNNDSQAPNLSIGYGNNIYTANQNKHRALDFSKSTSQDYPHNKLAETYSSDSIPTSTYESVFTKINDLISGIDKDGLYLIPMGASSELMYWNKPVLNYLLNQAITHKLISVKSEDQTWFEENLGVGATTPETSSRQAEVKTVNTYKVDDALAKQIQSYYGEMEGNGKSTSASPTQIGVDDFQSYTKLFAVLKILLTHLKNKQPLLAMVQSNLLELMSFLNKGADYDQFLFHKKANSNIYDYSFFNNDASANSSASNAPLKTVYDLIQQSIGNNGVWYAASKGASSTTDFKEGKLAFLFNSNSKYKKLFSKKKDDKKATLQSSDVLVTQEPFYYDATTQSSGSSTPKGAFWVQGGSIFGIKSNDPKKDHAARLFVKWLTSEKSNQKFNNKSDTQYNGSDWYALNSGYVPGTTAFWTGKDAKNNLTLLESINPAAAAAYQIFASAKTIRGDLGTLASSQTYTWGFKKSTDLVPFFEPVGELSHEFRVATDANGKGLKIFPDFQTYWNNLKNNSLIASYLAKNSNPIQN